MYIARAVIETDEYGIQKILISNEEKTKKFLTARKTGEKAIALGLEAPLVNEIFRAAVSKSLPAVFYTDYHNKKIRHVLISYEKHKDERFYNKYRDNHVAYREKLMPLSEVYVYSRYCRCLSCYDKYGFDSLDSICGNVPLARDHEKRLDIDMQKCTRCGKIFVESSSLDLYEKKYGKLALKKNEVYCWEPDEDDADYEYAPDSILSRNGYSAALTTSKRWEIISYLIDTGTCKAEIKDHLSYLIKTRGDRCYNALPKWKMDLEYVNDYRIEEEEKVRFY